jgi:cell division protein FtsW (lipid II flippase)
MRWGRFHPYLFVKQGKRATKLRDNAISISQASLPLVVVVAVVSVVVVVVAAATAAAVVAATAAAVVAATAATVVAAVAAVVVVVVVVIVAVIVGAIIVAVVEVAIVVDGLQESRRGRMSWIIQEGWKRQNRGQRWWRRRKRIP